MIHTVLIYELSVVVCGSLRVYRSLNETHTNDAIGGITGYISLILAMVHNHILAKTWPLLQTQIHIDLYTIIVHSS